MQNKDYPNRLMPVWAFDIRHESLRKSVRKRWYLRSSFPETDTEMRFCVQKNVLDSRREHSSISGALGLSPKRQRIWAFMLWHPQSLVRGYPGAL